MLMSSLLGVLHGFFPRHMLGWPGVGPVFHGEGRAFQLAFASLGLNWLRWNTYHRATVTPGLGAVAPPTEQWALRSWILIPYHGTGVQVGHRACEKSNALCSPPSPTPLTTHRKGLSRALAPLLRPQSFIVSTGSQ